jgi:hypothetical protein
VVIACFVLVVGLLGLFATLDLATHTTMVNRERQAETSLAREVIEDATSLAYTQLTPTALATALQPLVPNSTVSGQGLRVSRSMYTFTVSLNPCSLDDPTDGYGDHSSPPASGGVWCSDVAPNGTADSNPDDEKRVSVTVTPRTGAEPTVKLSTIIFGHAINGPAVSCLTTVAVNGCPGTNQVIGPGGASSLTFYVTTTSSQVKLVKWLVNGDPPPSAQIASGATDPYVPGGATSQFTWVVPTVNGSSVDGTYTISAEAEDMNGATGSRSSLQVTVNEHQVTAPPSLTAGYDQLIHTVDVQWQPSTDQDVLYYNVYHRVGSGSATLACSQVTGTSCTDTSALTTGLNLTAPTGPCSSTPTDGSNPSNVYWVVGVDTYPAGGANAGQPRESTLTSPLTSPSSPDADVCDNPPSRPTNLTALSTAGSVALHWTAPAAPGDIDPGDSIQGWRIYRWTVGSMPSTPAQAYNSRLVYVGAVNAGQPVTSYTDSSPDPNGQTQDYCVTAVDSHLNESSCSNLASG